MRLRPSPSTGGSTNAVLHLLAIAREAEVELEIDDFQTVSERTPLLADLKPSGRFVAADMHRAGGIPAAGAAFDARRISASQGADGDRSLYFRRK
jgi:dihydroxy-acid dehydratase